MKNLLFLIISLLFTCFSGKSQNTNIVNNAKVTIKNTTTREINTTTKNI